MTLRANGSYIGPRDSAVSTTAASGVWDLRTAQRYQEAGAWPVPPDPYFANVGLLLHMDGANGSTTFTDSSLNNFTVTAYGNAQISTTQSKFGGASAAFDGTGDYLEIPQNDATELDGDGTIEAWVYLLDYQTYSPFARSSLICNSSGGNATGVQWSDFSITNAGALRFYSRNFSVTSADAAVGLNQWHHVAASRSGSTLTLYVDGVSVASGTVTETLLPNNPGWSLRIGHFFYSDDPNRFLNGYLDELRITKGTARYTANFTPSTAAFPDA